MNKINWQNETDKIISGNDDKPRLLLHACCAPCSSASLEYLTEHFSVDVFFYNPNISTKTEYEKRLQELRRFVIEYPFVETVNVYSVDYDHKEFLNVVKGLESTREGGERCAKCFELRLGVTARNARELGYDYFGTTLTISPLKNADLINSIGLDIATVENVLYLPTDLKKKGRYQKSVELSREYNLYRQDFCGCEFSYAERRLQKK